MRFEYRTRDNSFYRLNPWARIAYLLTLFYLSVLFSGIPLQLEVMALVLLTAFLAGVLKEALYYSRIIIYMSLFLAAISIVFGPGGASIFRIYVFDITVDPVLFSISMTLRLISSVMSFEMVLLTVR
ncbi:MAG: energy-coupling factor transporter transmembrane protein EcfT [Candidatus Thermoplasmatota archaeon]|nr:energy-coupling factor transporter transmembrane protein EcfT [Candidatus Thermoplasmatota archaeon]